MYTEDQIRAAVTALPENRERLYITPVGVDGTRCELRRTDRYQNGAGHGPIARLLADCPDSEVVEWPAGHSGAMAYSIAYALRGL